MRLAWRLAASAVVLWNLFTGQARADLHVPQPLVNVGEVRRGALLAQRFMLVNRGPEAVAITDLRASCGCLTPLLEQRVYQPGEAGSLLLEINTLSQSVGPHTWQVQLSYRAGSQLHEVALQIVGRIVAEITVQPPILTLFADQAIRHEILVTDIRPQPLSITAVQTSSPRLKTTLAEPQRNEVGHWVRTLSLEVADDYPEGRHDEVLAILTDDPLYRELRVPITVVKRSRQRLSATPSTVTLTAPPGQAVPSRMILVRDRDDQSVAIERVVADDPALVCQWAEGASNPTSVKIGVERSRLNGSLDSAIHMHICKPVREILTIPVSVRCN
jgi:hypothetical protein